MSVKVNTVGINELDLNLAGTVSAALTSPGVVTVTQTGVGGSGTVTSVALTVPSRQTVTGSPVTTSGTLAITDNNESANAVFAGPSTGTPATPTFRALAPSDLPVATTSALGAVQPDGTTITVTSGGTISASGGGGSYSLGGAVTAANVTLGLGAGTGATVSVVSGVDGNHLVEIVTGTTPQASKPIYTFTFTASRGHATYPVAQSSVTNDTALNQNAYAAGGNATTYVLESNTVALNAGQSYLWTISAP